MTGSFLLLHCPAISKLDQVEAKRGFYSPYLLVLRILNLCILSG